MAYVRQEGQKADDAKVPTRIWSFFFKESFLGYFGIEKGVEVDWRKEHSNVYRRHNWKRQNSLPRGWEGAMNGFRRLGICWWRRRLLHTYVAWKNLSKNTTTWKDLNGHIVRFKGTSGQPGGKHTWARGHGRNTGQAKYRARPHRELKSCRGHKS